jgi:glycosyltransferase involved in cell wall biosynthesis
MANSKEVNDRQKPRILYIDMAYTIKMVRERELQQEFASRDCGGYFEHVWGIHPLADIPEKRQLKYEGFKVSQYEFSGNQTIIEGSSAYYSLLRFFFPLNFLVSQIRFLIYLIKLVRRERISIVLATEPYFSGLLGLGIKLFTKARLVLWVIANYDDIYKATGLPALPRIFRWRWLEKITEKIVFRRADLVAGGNQNNLEFALKNGARLNKSTVFPVGKLIFKQHMLEPGLREKDELFMKSNASYHFIYVGRLLDLKFPDDVIRSFEAISKAVPDCALVMAGDGPMKPALEEMAKEMGMQHRIHFLGNINQMRLANLLAGCFAVLSPLTGRSLVESALAGLPIIAYDRDWQPEFVLKNGAGVIVPFRDWQKMGEAAIHLIRYPQEAKTMGEASRRTGLEACDTEKLYGHEQKEFDKLLKR